MVLAYISIIMIQLMSDANKARSTDIYIKNREAGNIAVRPVTQLFDRKRYVLI